MPEDQRPRTSERQAGWDGVERRRAAQGAYKGDERRKVKHVAQVPGGNPQGGNPGGPGEDPTE
jgi:hypothetical protein